MIEKTLRKLIDIGKTDSLTAIFEEYTKENSPTDKEIDLYLNQLVLTSESDDLLRHKKYVSEQVFYSKLTDRQKNAVNQGLVLRIIEKKESKGSLSEIVKLYDSVDKWLPQYQWSAFRCVVISEIASGNTMCAAERFLELKATTYTKSSQLRLILNRALYCSNLITFRKAIVDQDPFCALLTHIFERKVYQPKPSIDQFLEIFDEVDFNDIWRPVECLHILYSACHEYINSDHKVQEFIINLIYNFHMKNKQNLIKGDIEKIDLRSLYFGASALSDINFIYLIRTFLKAGGFSKENLEILPSINAYLTNTESVSDILRAKIQVASDKYQCKISDSEETQNPLNKNRIYIFISLDVSFVVRYNKNSRTGKYIDFIERVIEASDANNIESEVVFLPFSLSENAPPLECSGLACISPDTSTYDAEKIKCSFFNFCEGDIPGYQYFYQQTTVDSESLRRHPFYKYENYELDHDFSDTEIEEKFNELQNDVVIKKVSVYKQPSAPLYANTADKLNDAIFFPTQPFGYGELAERKLTFEALDVLADWSQEGGKVVVKRHPRCTDISIAQAIEKAVEKGVYFTDASIHDIIPRAKVVLTVNSIVGLEALLHLKQVWIMGSSSYREAAIQILDREHLESNLRQGVEEVDEEVIKRTLFKIRMRHIDVSNKKETDGKIFQTIIKPILDSRHIPQSS